MLFNFLSEMKVPAGLCPCGASCLVVTASACLSCGRAVPVSASAVTTPVRTAWLRAGTRAVGLPHRRHPGHAAGIASVAAPPPPTPTQGLLWGSPGGTSAAVSPQHSSCSAVKGGGESLTGQAPAQCLWRWAGPHMVQAPGD